METDGNGEAIRVRVPAKLNVALHVGPLDANGYHQLNTVFQAVSLYDEITATPVLGTEIRVHTPHAEWLDDTDNLAVRAARLLQERYQVGEGCLLTVRKTIPVAGGMAGGSADAAGALVACARLWGLDLTGEELSDLAAELGSDVPFSLLGGVAIGTGRGDQLVPLLVRGTLWWVLVFDDTGLSTPGVYRRFDELHERNGGRHELVDINPELLRALAAGDAAALAPLLVNDLARAAVDLHPALADTLEAGREAGALAGLVSGSGPTCAFLARDESDAIDISNRLAATGRSVRRVAGPVSGARPLS
ncbi:4-(cytidine 5'-diphospho)-2-C-methyl-D-erythritol kinase [Enemella sp. A6]|uniref:4-(cytidine 5'-diphospho)-2-C-methyl-D-erythritol kinase n=1 Tax=Enemella sp. A6 TaxID=3440152 RepID=UPI003EBF9A84